jgi:soluble lytic murein transglycosylase-like protein
MFAIWIGASMMSKKPFAPPNTPAALQLPSYHVRSIFAASFCAFVAAALVGSARDIGIDLPRGAWNQPASVESPTQAAAATAKDARVAGRSKSIEANAAPKAAGRDSGATPSKGGAGDASSSSVGARQRPTNAGREIEALARALAQKYRISPRTTREYVRTAFREGARVDLDPLLIVAVMAVESSFDAAAESTAGALGLMQVIPQYHADKLEAAGGQSVLDPATNIQVGAKVLKEYIARHGDQVAGLLRYNGSLGDPRAAYARKVLGEKEWLQQAIQRAGSA